MTGEQWRPVPGHDGYLVTSLGQVLSQKRGRLKLLVCCQTASGYRQVGLHGGRGVRRMALVHRLVLEAFVGPCPDGMEVRHLDGDPSNNRLENLAYGTHAENMADRLRHGTNPNAAKTRCVNGHEFTQANTYWRGPGGAQRLCRQCGADAARVRRRRTASPA